MSKISLIIKREYSSRVKKKSFIIMTILGPILMVGLMALIIWISKSENEPQKIMVVQQEGDYFSSMKNSENYQFENFDSMSEADAKKVFKESAYTSLLYIPSDIINQKRCLFFFKKQPSSSVARSIERQIEKIVEVEQARQFKIDPKTFKEINKDFSLAMTKFSSTGEEDQSFKQKALVGFIFGIMTFMFIFMYGIQVMKSVIEEKTNRIVEVIITSVKPFQLMMGKIIGVALVCLTQAGLWVLLSTALFSVTKSTLSSDNMQKIQEIQMQQTDVMAKQDGMPRLQPKVGTWEFDNPEHIMNRINWPLMLGSFFFYFLCGYLLYSALFAGIGTLIDQESDSQQFMMPVTLPLMGAYIIAIMMLDNPESKAAFWGSLIPLTSPILMPIRLAMGEVASWELIVSMILLIAGFIGTTWLAGKIYRTGILMYGKKMTYKEVWKWIKYS